MGAGRGCGLLAGCRRGAADPPGSLTQQAGRQPPTPLPGVTPAPCTRALHATHPPQRHHLSGRYKPTDFFETAAMLITLVLMGKYLESAVSEPCL